MDELLEQFVIEGRDLVQQAFRDLLALEAGGHDPARVDGAFRAIHTLKGSTGLFDLAPFGAALHAAEDLMGTLRGGHPAPPGALGALLDCMGAADAWIEAIAATERLPADAATRSRELVGMLRGAPAAPAVLPGGTGSAQCAFRYSPSPDCFFMGDDPLALVRAIPGLQTLAIAPREPWAPGDYDPFRCNLVITGTSAAPLDAVQAVFRFVADQAEVQPVAPDAAAEPVAPGDTLRTLRVDAGRIDALADLVGELFVAKNRLSHLAAEVATADPALARALAANHADIDALAGSLHRAVMDLRMVPLSQGFRRLPLLVREVAGRLGRVIRFTMTGTETRADKATADGLFEPLLHVLRNAVDHGTEPPALRAAANKPAEGCITLQAELVAGQVAITVRDDGPGIDPAALRRTALARGLRTPAELDGMDDAATLGLIFEPGFSTAASVTDVSGRGVGMDAVRAALHAMGGEVTLTGSPGVGTSVRLTVPQAVTVTTAVIVESGGERFAIPIEQIAETVRIKRAAILPAGAGRAFVLRDRTVPFLRLADLLGQEAPDDTPDPGGDALVVVAASGAGRVGIGVDRFGARVDVVVRPLRGLLAGMPGMRGSALAGDGRVLLVLDLAEVAG